MSYVQSQKSFPYITVYLIFVLFCLFCFCLLFFLLCAFIWFVWFFVVVVVVLLERVMVINVTVNNISIIAWRSVVRKPSVCHMLLTN